MAESTGFLPLSAKSLKSCLTTTYMGHTIFVFPEVTSTNTSALQQLESGLPHGAVFLADQQTAGRGRLGREWVSPPGTNLYCSVVLTQKPLAHLISWIPLLTGIAVAEAMEASSQQSVALKWPNDILLNQKKVGGILCESTHKGPHKWGTVAGIGININSQPNAFPPDLQDTATSLAIECGREFDRIVLLASLLKNLESLYDQLMRSEQESVRSRYRSRCTTVGSAIRVHFQNGKRIEGFALDIGDAGELRVRLSSKPSGSTASSPEIIDIRAGDVVHVR